MKDKNITIYDGNEATASVAYRLSETIAIYPITPSSPMAESCEEWSSKSMKNIWSTVPEVSQLQSEAGVAGSVHGALTTGTSVTTFTASQGLLLMIPNMYKIAGELNPFVMHVTARAIATNALSIFGDHSDVMACRQTGFAMIASNSVQEAHDLAAIAHSATLKAKVPFLHFFDGFRTSHEINTFIKLTDDQLHGLIDYEDIIKLRQNALTPEKPVIRGTAQNPDVYFQSREAVNSYYEKTPQIVQEAMDKFASLTNRQYNLFDYYGDENATEVVVVMCSACETLTSASKYLNSKGKSTGVLTVRLFRPFSVKALFEKMPKTVKKIAVLDRTKEPGSAGEPLFQDVVSALVEARQEGFVPSDFNPIVVGGRYGIGSKEFDVGMALGVFKNLESGKPKNHFTIGIKDDVTNLSLDYDENFDGEDENVFRGIFFGLGSDGTVGANKNTIKIIGNETDNYAQAYFVYDSKKSGGVTISHLRFGKDPIKAPYTIKKAQFVGCHQFGFIEKFDILDLASENGVFLLNSVHSADTVWNHLPKEAQKQIIDKKLKFYVIDAYSVAKEYGMGARINTIMQTGYFAISGVLPKDEAIEKIKAAIQKTYGKKGEKVVQMNFAAVDAAVSNLHEVKVPDSVSSQIALQAPVSANAPEFVKNIIGTMIENKGDTLPVSAIPADGTWPTSTTKWEKRSIAQEIPVWDPSVCIQCNKCNIVCPHGAIRSKFYKVSEKENAPESFKSVPFRSKDNPDCLFTVQIAPEDCTGCGICIANCPGKNKQEPGKKAINFAPLDPIKQAEKENFDFFLNLPNADRTKLGSTVKDSQFMQPLFEFSGACSGCGETPYVKLLTQLFGDRLLIANATGCSSIYGGNLPTTPYCTNEFGRGPAWANSLFEDNAEFGYGFRLSLDMKRKMANELLEKLAPSLGEDFVKELINAPQENEAQIQEQRARISSLKEKLASDVSFEAKMLAPIADDLLDKAVWILGGDGWAYDIGFGGLDHLFASGKNVNILVLDTEVYSNTGGQASKSTNFGAVAKFATGGKATAKKDLGKIAMGYNNVYVASVSMGAKDSQVVQAMKEAESYKGVSIVIAYSHCISHGFNLDKGLTQQKLAVDSGYWLLYRYDPRRIGTENAPLKLDSGAPKIPVSDFINNENRYRILQRANPEAAKVLNEMQQHFVEERYAQYVYQASLKKEEPKA